MLVPDISQTSATNTIVAWAVILTASYRLTRLIVEDVFPPVVAFRRWLVKRTGAESSWVHLIGCGHCIGMWCSVLVLAMFEWAPWTRPLLAALAISAVVGIVADHEWD